MEPDLDQPGPSSVMSNQAAVALRNWELENNVENLEIDEIYKFEKQTQQDMLSAKPWDKE